MLTSLWQRVLELPPRTRYLGAGCIVAVVALAAMFLLMGGEEGDLQVQESAVPTEVPQQPVPQPETPGEVVAAPSTPEQPPQGVSPVNSSGGGGDGGGVTPEDRAIEDELNALLPPEVEPRTPKDVADEASPEVKYAGRVLTLWSNTILSCLKAGKQSPLDCNAAADKAAPGVHYQNGTLFGDIEFQIFRPIADGTKVWLIYTKGTECHGVGDDWEKCSAW